MTKKKSSQSYPLVSVCTPTFNRRPFIPIMFECFRNQTYPKSRIEWIIVDDGTDKIRDLVETSNIPQIRYFDVKEKMTLGAKRNYMHSFAKGDIIVYMDDDDYYPPERISHAVERLTEDQKAICAGSSEIYIYFKHIQKMIQCGPYGPNHATAGTFAFKRVLLSMTKYEENASVAEERAFLKDYTIPFVQLDPLNAILVFSHDHNSFDKRKMLENPHPDFLKESTKTVDMFIRTSAEDKIKQFFMNDIDKLLKNYEPGHPKMKPDVLKQIKEIEESRDAMIKEEMQKQNANGPIMMNRPGQEPIALTNRDVVNIITQLQDQLAKQGGSVEDHNRKVSELENIIIKLQKNLIDKTKELNTAKKQVAALTTELEEYKKNQEKPPVPHGATRIPIEIIDTSVKPQPEPMPKYYSKCMPECIVDVNVV